MRSGKLKVLVSAFATSPNRGSEYAVGWEYIKAIAGQHNIWAITAESEREAIETYLYNHPGEMQNVSFHFIPWREPTLTGLKLHVIRGNLYATWQKQCYALARVLDAEVDFDIVHHLNGTGFREPGYLWRLGKPFVWGPLGGLQYFPLRFLRAVPAATALFLLAKNLTTVWMMHIARRPRMAAMASAGMIAATKHTAGMIRRLWKKPSVVISEVLLETDAERRLARRKKDEPLRIIWCGRIDPLKALHLLLTALARLERTVQWELTIIGGGVLEGQCQEMAIRFGIAEHCRFLGHQPREKVLEIMRTGHVFVHTSLYELTGTVTVEAMNAGLPLVCLDHLGIKDVVKNDCGLLVHAKNVKEVVAGFTDALRRLWMDEESRYRMALAAQSASRRFSPEIMLRALLPIYADASNRDRQRRNESINRPAKR